MLRGWFHQLDRYAMNWAGFGEGHWEDRCPLCTRPVRDHPLVGFPDVDSAKWPHRWAAFWSRRDDRSSR